MKTLTIVVAGFLSLFAVTNAWTTSAGAVDLFQEYEKPSEVPVIGRATPTADRHGPPPPRSLVQLATHYLEVSNEAEDVRCHGVGWRLVACRAHLGDWVVARIIVSPIGETRDSAIRCETLRRLDGPLTVGACWDFMWSSISGSRGHRFS